MGIDTELLSCVGDLIDPQNKITEVVDHTYNYQGPTHFSEYHAGSTKLPNELINAFNRHLRKPTPEEYEQYAIKQAEEQERIRKRIEEAAIHGPPFLSDEWRWMMIDRRGGY